MSVSGSSSCEHGIVVNSGVCLVLYRSTASGAYELVPSIPRCDASSLKDSEERQQMLLLKIWPNQIRPMNWLIVKLGHSSRHICSS